MQRYIPGEIIRNKKTGKSLLVAHVYRICTIVIDLTENDLPIPRVLLARDYSDWVHESDMECTEKADYNLNPFPVFHYKHTTL